MKTSMQVMINRKPQQSTLSSGYVATEIITKIETDTLLAPLFNETIQKVNEAKTFQKKGGGCPTCHFNNYPDILVNFVREFKSLRGDLVHVAQKYMGSRQWIAHDTTKSWVNVVSNVVEEFVYEQKSVEKPDILPVRHPEAKPRPSWHRPPATSVEEKPVENPPENTVTPVDKPIEMAISVASPEVVTKTVTATVAPVVQTPPVPPPATVASFSPAIIESSSSQSVRRVIFKNSQAPGDIVMMTAAIRDLHINYPGKFITDVRTNSMSIWESNPYITKLDESTPGVEVYEAEYPLIQQSNQGPYHFSEGFTEHFEDLLGVRIKRRIGRGHIVMGSGEEGWGRTERTSLFGPYGMSPDVHYWILNAGYKNDFTAKMWPVNRYQAVVDHFKDRIVFVQIGHASHNHPKLDGTINLVGKTDDRMLIRLVWASSGVLTPCSYPMTLAAAVPVRDGACNGRSDRPCVVVAGGREPSHWQAHTSHQFIHTCGALPCCVNGGCWKSRVKPIGDGDEKDKKNMCQYVVNSQDGYEIPYCMDMITSDEVIRRIELYYSFYEPNRPKTHTYNK